MMESSGTLLIVLLILSIFLTHLGRDVVSTLLIAERHPPFKSFLRVLPYVRGALPHNEDSEKGFKWWVSFGDKQCGNHIPTKVCEKYDHSVQAGKTVFCVVFVVAVVGNVVVENCVRSLLPWEGAPGIGGA
jgi:hypothetical protein